MIVSSANITDTSAVILAIGPFNILRLCLTAKIF